MEGIERQQDEGAGEGTPLVRHAVMVGSLTLLSRLTGLFRVILIAHFLGTASAAAGAFRIAVILPNMFRRFLGEGALYSAFIPLYTEYTETRSAQETRLFAQRFFTLWVTALLVLTTIGSLSLKWLIPLLVEFFAKRGTFADPAKLELTARLSQLAFWYLLVIGCAALGQAVLTARRRFVAPSFAPVVANLAFVGSVFLLLSWFAPGREPFALVWAFLFGGLCQFVFILWPLWRAGVRFRPRNPLHDEGVRRALRLFVPGTIGAGVYQINIVASTLLAMALPSPHAVTSLAFSNLVLEFVLGIFVMALNTVGLPHLSRHAAHRDDDAFRALLARLARLTQFITVPSMVGLFVIHVPMLSLLFESGLFDKTSLEQTAAPFRYHMLGLVFIGWNRVLVSSFHARKNLRTPVLVAAVVVVVNIVLAYALSRTSLGHAGIALAATLSAILHTCCLAYAVRRDGPGARFTGLGWGLVRSCAAAAGMGCVCFALTSWWPLEGGKWMLGGRLCVAIALGAFSYFALSWLVRAQELQWLGAAVRRRFASPRLKRKR